MALSRNDRPASAEPLRGEGLSPMQPSSPSDCLHLKQEQKYLGMDPQRGRYADVFLKVCPSCQAHWIHYYFEYEHLTGRGRWYEGRITSEQAQGVTAATA